MSEGEVKRACTIDIQMRPSLKPSEVPLAAADKSKEMWVQLACAAMQSYSPPDDDETDLDDLVDDMVDYATAFADEMLGELEERSSKGKRKRRSNKRKSSESED